MDQYVYIGTYTERGSQGIYGFWLYDDGRASEPKLLAEEVSPTYLCQRGKLLYAVGEPSEGPGFVSAYRIDSKTNELSFLNRVEAPSLGICHIIMDPTESFLLVTSYFDATIQVYRILSDGRIGDMTEYRKRHGHGPHPVRQPVAHAHSCCFTPDGKYVMVCDLGTDDLVAYTLDTDTGKLLEVPEKSVKVPAGYGPRHMVFHPNGRYAYVAAEIVDRVLVYSYDAERGFTQLQDLPATLREDPGYTAAAIRVTRDGRHLYVSNRGEDTLMHYTIGDDGMLQPCNRISSQGQIPRDFALDGGDRWVICANQDSDTLAIYRRDPDSGTLSPSQVFDTVSMPVAVVIVEKQ